MNPSGMRPWIGAAVLAGAVALIVTVLPRAGERASERSARQRIEPSTSPSSDATGMPETAAAAVEPVNFEQTPGTAARSTREASPGVAPETVPPQAPVSPLERSPGYYPPADPESASVRLGRREAPEVSDLFQGGATSMDEFGRLVVAALNARDGLELHSLRVTQGEFEKVIWREFPQSRPITNITAADAWSLSDPRSRTAVSRAVSAHGGRRLRFLTIESGSVQTFTNFLLHRDVVINAVDEGTAEIHKLTLAPSIAERKGRFKALLYHD